MSAQVACDVRSRSRCPAHVTRMTPQWAASTSLCYRAGGSVEELILRGDCGQRIESAVIGNYARVPGVRPV